MDRLRTIVRLVLALAALSFIGIYVVVTFLRVRYPFELEWMEGVMVDHVRRLLAGQPIYARPSLDFVSLLYPPLYYVAGAASSRLFGVGFLALRLVSFVSSLGVFAVLFAIVRRETRSSLCGLVSAGLFAAMYARTGGWFDLARLDSFYLLLLLGAVAVLRNSKSASSGVLAGLLIAAAFLTKQSALVILVPLTVAALVVDPRRTMWFAGTAAVAMTASVLYLDRSTSGWFTYYCYTLPAHHPSIPRPWTAFWRWDILSGLRVVCLGAVVHIARCVAFRRDRGRFFFPLLAAGMIGSSWSVRTMVGAEVNNLLPAYAALSILAALGLHDIDENVKGMRPPVTGLLLAAEILLVFQFVVLRYDPRRQLPTPADAAAGTQVVATLARVQGDVFIPHHDYLARLAGKRGYAHTLAMDNVFLDDNGPARQDLERELLAAIRDRRFGAVVIESDEWRGQTLRASYPDCRPLFARGDVFWPVTGGHLRPEWICLPAAR